MHYKIVGVSDSRPEDPSQYFGEFREKKDEHPLMTALAVEFGDDDAAHAVYSLKQWSGGEVRYWEKDVEEYDPEYNDREGLFLNDNVTFHVFLNPDKPYSRPA